MCVFGLTLPIVPHRFTSGKTAAAGDREHESIPQTRAGTAFLLSKHLYPVLATGLMTDHHNLTGFRLPGVLSLTARIAAAD
ncbi:MAG TPA: hypothetical protein DCG12_02520 [Planctomycetaceae bacterium]|nr:hypothetical protein [Planctomycetaceae bacterium]